MKTYPKQKVIYMALFTTVKYNPQVKNNLNAHQLMNEQNAV